MSHRAYITAKMRMTRAEIKGEMDDGMMRDETVVK